MASGNAPFAPRVDRSVADHAIVERIAAGDERAFADAYDRYSDLLFGSVLRFCGDRETAAEVVQDAFLSLWRRAHQFNAESGSLLGWLLRIARNRAIDRYRSENRRPEGSSVALDDAVAAPERHEAVDPWTVVDQ